MVVGVALISMEMSVVVGIALVSLEMNLERLLKFDLMTEEEKQTMFEEVKKRWKRRLQANEEKAGVKSRNGIDR